MLPRAARHDRSVIAGTLAALDQSTTLLQKSARQLQACRQWTAWGFSDADDAAHGGSGDEKAPAPESVVEMRKQQLG